MSHDTPDSNNHNNFQCPIDTQNKLAKGLDYDDGSLTTPTRRGFLKMLVGGVALLWAGVTTVPFLQYLASGNGDDEAATDVASVTVGAEADFAPGQGKNFQFGSIPAIVLRTHTGDFKAYNATCTHLGCTVQYSDAKEKIWCACHGGQFDPATGKNIAGPPPKPLAPLVANVIDGNVVVTRV
jgi:cytochrome b6-f complex iron-sulfur subunit